MGRGRLWDQRSKNLPCNTGSFTLPLPASASLAVDWWFQTLSSAQHCCTGDRPYIIKHAQPKKQEKGRGFCLWVENQRGGFKILEAITGK